jgi:hypothetical protein
MAERLAQKDAAIEIARTNVVPTQGTNDRLIMTFTFEESVLFAGAPRRASRTGELIWPHQRYASGNRTGARSRRDQNREGIN